MALQETLKAISDPVRRKILVSLRERSFQQERCTAFADDSTPRPRITCKN